MSVPMLPTPSQLAHLSSRPEQQPRNQSIQDLSALRHDKQPESPDESAQLTEDASTVAPANFRPYFALVEDATTGQHTHPRVHYIFSDDDPDIVTSAVLDSNDGRSLHSRVVLLDMSADGKTVQTAHSLSPAWQVSHATVTQAPSWRESDNAQTTSEGLMLSIKGIEAGSTSRVTNDENDDTIQGMTSTIEKMRQDVGRLQALLQQAELDQTVVT